ncbi:hypothetical protein CTEN210_01217 [Chaetoceros tenuissimus]|uniref:WD repeat-containing protein 63 n=1 Tax=Chaetoceros tenuissimus TaxID=426638 RepID=A0AAD3CFL8_9STRA|nr:hypothetical protein CTEN210_01217 [Chaetoceros tenuissimus]
MLDSYTQTHFKASNQCQTPHFPLVDKGTSYEYQTETINTQKVLEEMNKSLQKLSPMFEQALQENEVVDIFTDYLDIPEKGDLSMFRTLEEELKVLSSFSFPNLSSVDSRLSQGEAMCLQVNPKNKNLVAVSLSNSKENHGNGGMNYGIVLIWETGKKEPRYILRSPTECKVLKFSQPHLLVGGCSNGSVLLWDIKDLDPFSSKVVDPVLQTHASQVYSVEDIVFLPPDIQVNIHGQLVDEKYLDGLSHQFYIVSKEGLVLFYDLRLQALFKGELPFIAKVKPSSKLLLEEEGFPITSWKPIFKFKPRREKGLGELALCKSFHPFSYDKENFGKSEIICLTEDGELLSINWTQEEVISNAKVGKEPNDYSSEQYFVTWMKGDCIRKGVSLQVHSKFFPKLALCVSDFTFHLWTLSKDVTDTVPLLTSRFSENKFTSGLFSNHRPAVIFLSRSDGHLEIWDLINEGSLRPSTVFKVCNNGITGMDFSGESLLISDSSGVVHVLDLASQFTKPYPDEMKFMEDFLSREEMCKSFHVAKRQEDEEEGEEKLASIIKPVLKNSNDESKEDAYKSMENAYREFEKLFLTT